MSSKRFSTPGVLEMAHQFVQSALERTPAHLPRTAIDATVGNGYDTVWLAKCVGSIGQVIGCDVQKIALDTTYNRLVQEQLSDRVLLYEMSHANLYEHIPGDWKGQVSAIMANLGYLPGADKEITTTADSSVSMIRKLLPYLRVGGIMTLAIYSGHPGGQQEAEAVTSFVRELEATEWRVLHATFPNQTNHPPELVSVERTGPWER